MTPARRIMFAGKMLINLLGEYGNFDKDSNGDGVADGWASDSICSVSNNIQTSLPLLRYQSVRSEYLPAEIGDISYVCAYVKSSSPKTYIQTRNNSTTHPGNGEFKFLSLRTAIDRDTFYFDVINTNDVSDWTEIQAKQAYMFNLTRIFGAGNEPSKEAMDAFMQAQTEYFVSKTYV